MSGCELIPIGHPLEREKEELRTCELVTSSEASARIQQCNLNPWLDYWISISQLDWSVRKDMIAELSAQRDNVKTLKIILLSNVNDTPYQSRLRAQSYGEKLLANQTDMMANFVHYLILDPAQKRLELESAIATLSSINRVHAKEIEVKQEQLLQQSERLQEQEQQIDKLLQLEKSIVNKPIVEQR